MNPLIIRARITSVFVADEDTCLIGYTGASSDKVAVEVVFPTKLQRDAAEKRGRELRFKLPVFVNQMVRRQLNIPAFLSEKDGPGTRLRDYGAMIVLAARSKSPPRQLKAA